MFIRQNSTAQIPIGIAVDVSDGATMETTLSLASADSAKAYLGGDNSVVDISGYTFAAVATMDGLYNLTLQTGITDTVGLLRIVIEDVSLALPIDESFWILEEEVFDALYGASAAGFQAGPTLAVPANTTKPPLNPTLEQAVMYLYWRIIYGQVTVDGTEEIVFADNGTTELYTRAVTDSGGTLTYAEPVAGT